MYTILVMRTDAAIAGIRKPPKKNTLAMPCSNDFSRRAKIYQPYGPTLRMFCLSAVVGKAKRRIES